MFVYQIVEVVEGEFILTSVVYDAYDIALYHARTKALKEGYVEHIGASGKSFWKKPNTEDKIRINILMVE